MNRRHLLLIGLLVLAASYLIAGGIIDPTGDPDDPETIDRDQLVQPAENGSYVWPYTSRDRSIDERTLAINLIVHGPDEQVQQTLVDQEELEWEELDLEAEEEPEMYEDADDSIRWDDAHGSTRYTYVDTEPHGGQPVWIEESYQLHTGTYLGSRYHIRAYTTEQDEWTVMQVHEEYFDLFRLRHSVTDIQGSQNALEAEFLDEPYVEEVRREYHGTHQGWNDGWVSVVELAAIGPTVAGLLFGIGGLLGLIGGETTRGIVRGTRTMLRWAYRNSRGFVLVGALTGLVVGVRAAGLAVEAAVPWITPQAFVGVLYPALVVGLPVVTIVLTQPLERATRFLRLQRIASWLGRPLEPQSAFTFTIVGLGLGFVLDIVGIGITTLPLQLLLHRLGLMFALGLLAAGSARSDAEGAVLFGIGMLGWIVGLAMPLFGYI
ncbi:hypothetical protein C483_04259 [Natrialba hulunbeirensis JCM 10989]|uniref:Uncharacterized protein n=1 Tax=Natrialba hulunbeirensis JCM 10989 TaxID=1227493 RepID=M0A677_9EURY|nr:hypothetical protein [Natrialba hulunbeirensis]ELY93861.1 hypothetical protein C483_04259 [Natrialba hulunbeirensis JCM 10989]